MDETTQAEPTYRLIAAAVCEDAARTPDDALTLSRVFFFVTPDRFPYRQRITLFSAWAFETPGQVIMRAQLFSPTGELISELSDEMEIAEAPMRAVLLSPFHWVELNEAGDYELRLVGAERIFLKIPLHVSRPPVPDEAAE